MSTPDTPRAVRIVADPGHASVVIDGVDVGPRLIGYTVEHRIADALPVVVLHAAAPAAELEGFARVVVADPQPPGEAVAEFLEGIDAEALERAALERGDCGHGRYDLTRAMLRQLADWATGKGGG